MTMKVATTAAAVATAATPRRRRASGFARMAAFLLVVSFVLADVIRVCECRTLREDNYQLQRIRRDDKSPDSSKVAVSDEDEDSEGQEADGGGANTMPSLLTSGLVVETIEGTTVNLPCRVANGSDDYAVIWINGTKSIMTDYYPMTTDPRVKPGTQLETAVGIQEYTLIIEQVTRQDSGSYTCRITTTPPIEITHTLRVTHPAKVLTVQAMGPSGLMPNVGSKKMTVKQGELVQLVCSVAGYPEPTVQWTRRTKYHQQPLQSTTSSPDHDQKVPDSASPTPSTVVVSNTNEVRIESVVAYRDAGYYECSAHNSITTGSSGGPNAANAHLGIDLEVEFLPEIVVPRLVVNTGETYDAQMTCIVQAFPKVKVTWEKEILTPNGPPSSTPVAADSPHSRYETTRLPASHNTISGNATTIPAGPTFLLKVKKVDGPQDFGRYRCRAENRVGISYSDYITLTGSPAQPQPSYVHVNGKAPELAWTVDSLSPLMGYQLQYRRQQDSPASWTDVKPQPQVVESSTGGNAGDERRYSVSYVFGDNGQAQQPAGEPATVPITLQHGTTYVARLKAHNVHGWSDWSTEVVFSEASVGDASGASGLQQYYSSALVTSIVLAVTTLAATAASTC
ncbi:neural cell adhesion molecule 1-like isoform X2 [Myzus persicae]|uniref:neural cell adhesion molecule 1-like isoform X2 n=1 Tax=Myzus persicae TaxID=13164 RepID=UPI000B9330DC|nr:neural cell adhesion molecule 1-like isoform X2 [Myzus persicae]